MVCESWKQQLDTYLDGELPEADVRTLEAHMRACPACSADILPRVQVKRAIHSAGRRFTPSAELRKRVALTISPRPQPGLRRTWLMALTLALIVLVGALSLQYLSGRSGGDRAFSEIADLHVATLASSSPVDVISTDRHTVKPWFQGRIPFSFNLPELQNSEFSLLGGRMAYLDQAPGAHLIYAVRKHRISVFIFQERAVPGKLPQPPEDAPFNMQTWTKGGLRYFVISDASPGDVTSLANLFKAAS